MVRISIAGHNEYYREKNIDSLKTYDKIEKVERDNAKSTTGLLEVGTLHQK